MGTERIPKVQQASRLRSLLSALALVAVIASACGGSSDARPSLRAQTIDSKVIDITDVLEEDAVLWFWAPW